MSKGVFINALETYIGWALYDEFIGEKPGEGDFNVYGTYFEDEKSDKPLGVKKMMKRRQKPGLFRKYMEKKFDVMIYDLHGSNLDDVRFAIDSLVKKPPTEEKIFILISSFLSWGKNQAKMVPEKKPEEGEEETKKDEEPKTDEVLEKIEDYTDELREADDLALKELIPDETPEDELDEEQIELRKLQKKIIQKRQRWEEERIKNIVNYIEAPYEEEDYQSRIPCDYWEEQKEIEDRVLSLKMENVKFYVICAGIPYGYAETVFNYHFKSAWLQSEEGLPYFENGDNKLPTIHVKDLCKIVKMVIDKKPEQYYIIAIDQTSNRTSKELVSSISKNVGNGNTMSMSTENPEELNYFNDKEDLFIDPKLTEKRKISLKLTEKEFDWRKYLYVDIWLKQSKIIEEEYEWWCKDFNLGIPKLLSEFAFYRGLRPLKIILNCNNSEMRTTFALLLSKFFNIPIISYSSIVKVIKTRVEEISEEEFEMFKPFLILKNQIEKETDEGKKNELMFDVLKGLLRGNVCQNRGYVLTGIPVSDEELKLLYWTVTFKELEEGDEGYEPPDPNEDQEEFEEEEIPIVVTEPNNKILTEDQNADDEQKIESQENMENDENEGNDKNEGDEEKQAVENENVVEQPQVVKKKKKKPEKPKKYKRIETFNKDLLPESVIIIRRMHDDEENENEGKKVLKNGQKKENHEFFFNVQLFYQQKKIEILDLMVGNDKDEMFETIRIFVERAGRPFNYFQDFEKDIHEKRLNLIRKKEKKIEEDQKLSRQKIEEDLKAKEDEYWAKMAKRIEKIEADKAQLEADSKEVTRKFLLLNIMPILTKGLLEVCKINPIDPIDHLADYLFANSADK